MAHLSPAVIIALDQNNRRIHRPSSDKLHTEHLQDVIEGHINSNFESKNILLCKSFFMGENAKISDRKMKTG